jgi:hypothetical protein
VLQVARQRPAAAERSLQRSAALVPALALAALQPALEPPTPRLREAPARPPKRRAQTMRTLA